MFANVNASGLQKRTILYYLDFLNDVTYNNDVYEMEKNLCSSQMLQQHWLISTLGKTKQKAKIVNL